MLLSNIKVVSPRTMEEALKILDDRRENIRIIAGGSDIILQLKDGIVHTEELLNIKLLEPHFRYIRMNAGELHIGALTTYSDIIHAQLTKQHAPVLVDASRTVGAIQLQNTATLGGNLGNASPAADGVPPLYALDANVVLESVNGQREIPIEDFFVGYRKKAMESNELIREAHFRAMQVPPENSAYMKLGLREANAISIVDVAIWAKQGTQPRTVVDTRVALGAVAPTILRARRTEEVLRGREVDDDLLWKAARVAAEEGRPIDDLRGSAAYRREMISSLVFEGFQQMFNRMQ